MDVKLEQTLTQQEIEVLIRYGTMNRTVRRLVELVRSFDKTVPCALEQQEIWVSATDIYYAESVDKHTFVYCRDTVYRCGLRLYQLLEELSGMGFIQVSKFCVLNLNVLESIRPLMNSRLEALLSNGEKVNVTRKYVAQIKKALTEVDAR